MVCLFLLHVVAASEKCRVCSTSGIVNDFRTSWSNWYSRVIGADNATYSFPDIRVDSSKNWTLKRKIRQFEFHPIRKTPLSTLHFRLLSLSLFFSLSLALSFSVSLSIYLYICLSLSLSILSITIRPGNLSMWYSKRTYRLFPLRESSSVAIRIIGSAHYLA